MSLRPAGQEPLPADQQESFADICVFLNPAMTASPDIDEFGFSAADEDHIRREKSRGRELRKSQWWKNRLATGRCHYCRGSFPPRELTMDHVVPISRGGRSARGNVVPCCKECNTRKQHMLPVEWSQYLDSLRRIGAHELECATSRRRAPDRKLE